MPLRNLVRRSRGSGWRRATLGAAAIRPRILILTTYDVDAYVYEALGAGARHDVSNRRIN